MTGSGDWWHLTPFSRPIFYTEIKSRRGAGHSRGHSRVSRLLVCASVNTAPPASTIAPAFAPARGMIGRVLNNAAPFLCFLSTMDSQPTEKVEGFVRGGQDKTPTQKKRNILGPRRGFEPQAPTAQICVSGGAPAATLRPSTQSRRDYLLTTVQIKLDIFNLPRCTSAESFFSCFNSVAARALANCNEHVAEPSITAPTHTQRSLHGAKGS